MRKALALIVSLGLVSGSAPAAFAAALAQRPAAPAVTIVQAPAFAAPSQAPGLGSLGSLSSSLQLFAPGQVDFAAPSLGVQALSELKTAELLSVLKSPAPSGDAWQARLDSYAGLTSSPAAPLAGDAPRPRILAEGLSREAARSEAPVLASALARVGELRGAALFDETRSWMDGGRLGHEAPEASPAPAPGGEAPRASKTPSLGARAVRGLLGAARAVTESLDRRIPTPPSVGASAEAGVKPYLRFWMSVLSPLVNVFYRPRVRGLENLPKGGALLLSNHVSFLDVVMLHFATRRPIRFLMFSDYYENPYLHWFVKQFRPIPIRPKEYGGNKEAILQALQDAKEAAQQGDLVLIFPEGTLTPHGMLTEFKRGFEYIAHDLGRPVIPIYLDGLWRSIFSRGRAKSLWENVKDLVAAPFGDVSIRFGKPLEQPDIAHAFQAEMELGVASFTERVARSKRTIPRELVRVAKAHWATKAVVDSTGKLLSYGKLLTASILLSGLLGGLFAGRGLSAADTKNVGVLLPPTAGGVLANAALGIRGSVPVNLNYTASAESIDNALSKTNARVILTSRKFLAALEEKAKKDRAPFFWSDYKSRFVFVEDLAAGVPKWKSALLFVLLTILPTFLVEHFFLRSASRDLNDTAAIVFTSGSSGLGNGAELSHMNIQSNIEMLREIFPMKNLRSFLGVLPFFHVFGFTVTMWMPLMLGMGAAYHVHPREYEHIETLAAAQRPDILIATPTFLAEYTQHVAKAALSSLKLVIVGASALPEDVRQAFLAKFGVVPLEGYGATEFSPVVSVNVPDDGDGVGNVPGTVGHFLPGTAVAVVDPATFQLVPFGEPGVLLVAGPHVMKGYIGEPEKTARNARGPWRMTGDIATLDAKGFIRILGRVERFAKVMGEKVDLEGVERKLNAAAGAGRAVFAVTSVPDPKLGERLVVLNAGYEGNIDLLLARLIEQGVPHLWLPTTNSFYRVPELPMLGSGKLDLRRLKELALQLSAR